MDNLADDSLLLQPAVLKMQQALEELVAQMANGHQSHESRIDHQSQTLKQRWPTRFRGEVPGRSYFYTRITVYETLHLLEPSSSLLVLMPVQLVWKLHHPGRPDPMSDICSTARKHIHMLVHYTFFYCKVTSVFLAINKVFFTSFSLFISLIFSTTDAVQQTIRRFWRLFVEKWAPLVFTTFHKTNTFCQISR